MTVPPQIRALVDRALTWYRTHSERDRRVILGVLVATALSAVYLVVVDPLLSYRKGLAQEIADGQEDLERAMRFLAAKDVLRAEREDLRKRLAQSKKRLLPGGTATLGAAALQERTNALAAEKGITIQSTQVMKPAKEDGTDPYRKVAVRETISGELKPLADFVAGLEFDRQLTIPYVEISRRGAVAGAKGPRTLSATVEVSGFVQGGAKDEGATKPEGEGAETAEAATAGPVEGEEVAGATTTSLTDTSSTEAAPTTVPAPSSTTTTVATTATVRVTTTVRPTATVAPITAPPVLRREPPPTVAVPATIAPVPLTAPMPIPMPAPAPAPPGMAPGPMPAEPSDQDGEGEYE